MEYKLYNMSGKETSKKIELSKDVYGCEPNDHCIYLAVKSELASNRQGTSSSKTRAQVRGGGAKPWRQKGTGRARQGSIRTPLRPGGGIIFGPKPRSYNLDMNRKERRLALRTALMTRVSDIKAVEDFGSTLKQPKTSDIINGLARLGIKKTEKVLVILDSPSDVIKKSINNIQKVKLIAADQLNVFDILNANQLVIGQSAINKIQEVYAS